MNFITKPLIKLFASLFLFATAVGMNFVTFPAVLLKNGIDPLKIGFASSAEIIGGIFMALILGKILRKILVKNILLTVAITYSTIVALIFFCKSFYLWIILVFAIGMCWVAYVVIRQAWMNVLISDENRGIGIGLYSMIISIGLGTGPMLVKLLGAENYISFITSAIFIISSFLILDRHAPGHRHLNSAGADKRQSENFLFFLKTNPRCFLARFFFDLQNFCLLSFAVVFGKKIGLSAESAGLLITAFMSSFFADFLVGIILKKHNAYKVLNVGFIGYLIFIAIVGIYRDSYTILLCSYFILGIFAACIYIATIVIANEFYQKDQLVLANAALQSAGSSGSLCGGLIGGILIQSFGADGYIITVVMSCMFYMIFLMMAR